MQNKSSSGIAMKLKKMWKKILGLSISVILACVSLALILTYFNVDVDGKLLSFTSSQGVAENLEGIGSAYNGDGYYLTSFYDTADGRKSVVKKMGEGGEVQFETELTHATIDGLTDKGVFSTVIGVTENKVIAFTANWYYLYELTDNGLVFLDAYAGNINIGAGTGVRNYAFDVYEDTIDIYTLDNRGSNAATVSVYIEKTTIVGDTFTGSVFNEIKRASGKRLTNMGAIANGIAVTEDHQNVIVVFNSAKAMMFGSDLADLAIEETAEYKEKVKTISVGPDTSAGGNTVTSAQYDGKNALYVCLQNRSVYRLTETDFATYGTENYAPVPVVTLDEYGSYCGYDQVTDTLFTVNEDGNTVYVINAAEGKLDYSVALNFKIKNMVAAYGTDTFVCQWQDTVKEKIEFTAYDYNGLNLLRSVKVWKTVLAFVVALSFASAILFTVSIYSKNFTDKAIAGVKYFFGNVWKWKYIYLLMLPSFTLLFLFSLWPSIQAIFNSFYEYELGKPKVFVGLENYRELIVTNSGLFLEIVRNTILLVLTYLITQIVPPVLYAYMIMLLRNKQSVNVIRGFLYIPGLLPTIAAMLMWRYGIYGINPDGALNVIIRNFGGTPLPFLGDSRYAIWSILFIGFPWVGGFLLFYGALMTVPTEVYDACELEGCGLIRRFFVIDLPFIMGQVKYVSIGAIIAGVKSVGRIMATTEGQMGTMTLMYKLYDYLNNNQYGMASAIAVIMVLLLAGISLARVKKMLKKENAYD